jgi:sugar lactone lactonase YvrE
MKTYTWRFGGFCGLIFATAFSASSESFKITTIAGLAGQPPAPFTTGDGTNSSARFTGPAGLALDSQTNLYVTDGSAIRKVAPIGPDWVATTLAGVAWVHGSTDDTNNNARFNSPNGIAVDSGGSLYVADTVNHTIRKLTPTGTNWVASTLAGVALSAGPNDGSNSIAKFNYPYGIAAGNGGVLFVADTGNHMIRKVTPIGTNWVVTTIAGTNTIGSSDGTNANARFSAPAAIAIDSATNLFVTDFNSNVVRKITAVGANWVVSTIAGTPGTTGGNDGTNSFARFNQPQGVAVDSSGNLYVADSGNNSIRKIKPSGTNWIVTTIAGLPGTSGSSDGIGAFARFQVPNGIAANSAGKLLIADAYNDTIRAGDFAIVLNMVRSGNQLTLSWPLAATNYVLETTNKLPATGTWTRLTNGVVTSGDNYVFVTNITAPSSIFRLHKP